MLHVHLADTEYPTSDGQPMSETDVHRDQMVDLIKSLEFYFEGQCTYVSGNILIYYEKNDLNKRCAPDVLVALGVPPHKRDNYLLWREGKAPDFVIEVTSKSTRSRDTGKKKKLYALSLIHICRTTVRPAWRRRRQPGARSPPARSPRQRRRNPSDARSKSTRARLLG